MNMPLRETTARSDEARAAETAKTARLRALRLAKEATDREAEQSAAAAKAKFKPGPALRAATRIGPANEAG